ncbi:protein YgfX [Pseudomonas syringae group sp. J248-6]|uniref:protein YgfX n=1 Tax=Pseudomonas syringae group sp. J248-6 TaxID=3079590 RepID=UPI002907F13F|nr:protein YgfX [Pseudomonas syringae group sp. J248-6]MDU8541889.1 protein YgfX [Pseudomonas syringae group sp. J248-6]
MSSPSDRFECHWQASRLLLTAYLAVQLLALVALSWLNIASWALALGVLFCLMHAAWTLPRSILLSHPAAFTALKRDHQGWQLWNQRDGWQPVQLCPDSLALPLVVILRFRTVIAGRPGRPIKSCCIPLDALTPDIHRHLRVRLKFSRRKWAVPE